MVQEKSKWRSENLNLTFVVLFTKPNPNDCLRIYHKEQLIDEIICDSHVKKIHVPIRYQTDVQFLMISKNNENVCEFYFVSLSTPLSNNKSLRDKMPHIFYTLDWQTKPVVPLQDTEYFQIWQNFSIPFFGMQIHKQKARPDYRNKVCWKSNIKMIDSNNSYYWHDEQCNKTFVRLENVFIAEFRPGHLCFIRRPISGSSHINVFRDINIDFDKNLCHLTKFTGKNITIPSSHIFKFKKIQTEREYLDFIWNCLLIWPVMVSSWLNGKL